MNSEESLLKHKERLKMKLFMEIDKIAGMMGRGRMTIIAGRPSVGKTSFALSLLAEVALKKEHPLSVAMFSMEMTGEQITRRLLCSVANIPEMELSKIGKMSDWNKITHAATSIMKAKILIDSAPSITIEVLKEKAVRLKRDENIDLMIIDYLQLMRVPTASKSETGQGEPSLVSAEIKTLAKELDTPILVLAQLDKDTELRRDARPSLSELGETGTLEQDADIVAFLHRNIREHDKVSEEEKCKGLCSELIIGKNRYGETGTVPLLYFPDTMTFSPNETINRHRQVSSSKFLHNEHERFRMAQRESLRQAEHLFQSLMHQGFTEGEI